MVRYRFYEKETAVKSTVQKESAMEENVKMQILAQDLVRRLNNSSEELGKKEKARVVDTYAQKLLNSGYDVLQVRKILINGIKGFENRKLRYTKNGWKLKRTAKESKEGRIRKSLLSKSSWYKKKKAKELYNKKGGSRNLDKRAKNETNQTHRIEAKSVLFVQQTNRGELGRRLREVLTRISPMLGFGVKVVERNGSSLRSKFPQSSLWEGEHCGRGACVTCNQGADFKTPCTRKSTVYENVCVLCNAGAGSKDEVKDLDMEVPSLYVGETSRTIQERAREHWADYRGGEKAKMRSHIYKHQELQHKGEDAKFMLRTISFHRSALSRQTAEAVRIKRRGGDGAVLNSRSEYNRCYIPRLRVVDEEETKKAERMEEEASRMTGEELLLLDSRWERSKTSVRRGKQTFSLAGKRGNYTTKEQRAPKRMKYALLNNWGERKEVRSDSTGDTVVLDDLDKQHTPSSELSQSDIRQFYPLTPQPTLPVPPPLPQAPRAQNNSSDSPGSPVTPHTTHQEPDTARLQP